MRGKILGIIEGLDELIVKVNRDVPCKVGDIVDVKIIDKSPNANRYYWELNGQLAQAENKDGILMYKEQVKDMRVFQPYLMETVSVDMFSRLWTSNHHGRFIETRESKQEGKTIVLAYYGSSDFNKEEMSRLIDRMVEDVEEYNKLCRQDGRPGHQISILPPEEEKRLITMWGIKMEKNNGKS